MSTKIKIETFDSKRKASKSGKTKIEITIEHDTKISTESKCKSRKTSSKAKLGKPKLSPKDKAIATQADRLAKSMASLSLKMGNSDGGRMMRALRK